MATRQTVVRVERGDERQQPLRRDLGRDVGVSLRLGKSLLERLDGAGFERRSKARGRAVGKDEREPQEGRERKQPSRQLSDADQDEGRGTGKTRPPSEVVRERLRGRRDHARGDVDEQDRRRDRKCEGR
jgi:hypothetical protein